MAASIAFVSTEAIGLNPELLLWERDILLLIVVVVFEERLVTEDGEEDLGVDISEGGVVL